MSLLPLYPLSRPAASLCALFRQHPAGLETVFFQQFVPVPAGDTGHACGGPGIVAAQRPYPGHIVPLRLMPPAAQRRKGPPRFRHGRQIGHATGPGFGQRGTDLPAAGHVARHASLPGPAAGHGHAQAGGEVRGQQQGRMFRRQTGPLQRMEQLAHIARPVVFGQHLQQQGGKLLLLHAVAAAAADDRLPCQQGDLVPAPAQGRDHDGHTLQAVKQILAKAPVLTHGLQILIGGRHQAKIALHLAHLSHRTETAQLQRPQKSPLYALRQVAHLVQEERALMRRPGILLLDRTIAEADPDVQEVMRKEFANINRELGITVIYATDSQKTAMALGTRMIVMNEGVICQEDSAQNIYNHPGSLFVAGFFGTPRMNLSIAKVTEENGSVVLKFSSGTIPLSEKKGKLLRELGYVGKEVFTGVRPDKVAPAKNGENGEITGELIGGEEIDDAPYIRFRVGENEFLAKAEGGENLTGKKMSFKISGDNVYLFDKETEKIIAE